MSCLGFKSANPISHTENDYVVGIFITKSVRNAHGKAPAHTRAVCVWPKYRGALFFFCQKLQMLFGIAFYCFL